ncbi:hypothetical protein [Cystobacter ferrugineus]|nr:hypothetical protein [Cystobacter ferrugineus]
MNWKWLLSWVCLACAACARSSPAQRPGGEASPGMAFTSSLAVLLEHREELALTPPQVERFEQLDFTLREKNAVLQHELESLRAQARKNNRPWHGGYQGGGSHDVHGGKGGSMSGPADEDQQKLRRRERLERMEATLRAMQDNDSQAYLAAEELMTDAQKPRARELFSQERENLLEQLNAMHYQIRKGDY